MKTLLWIGFALFMTGYLFLAFYIGHKLDLTNSMAWWSIPVMVSLIGWGIFWLFFLGAKIEEF
jgi:hypothetical protein